MAEEEKAGFFPEKEDGTSQSKDTYIPEEPTTDVSISLLDIQIPSTPESSKGQISDGDTSRLESPKTLKPVLGKVQAKKRLMAFANKFKVLPKSQIKSNLSQHTIGVSKVKHKAIQDDTNINRSRKKTEEKVLAIEEIRREESKSKMLLAEAMAAASMEDENHLGRNTANLLQNRRRMKNKYDSIRDSHRSTSKSTTERKYSERHRHRHKTERDSSKQEIKERIEDTERFTQKSPQDREKHEKRKKHKDDRNRRDTNKMDIHRDKKEEGRDKKEIEKDKREETKEKREEIKHKKENIKENQNTLSEMEMEYEDMKETDKEKEKELMQCTSWAKLRKSGLSLDNIIHLRRRDNVERIIKNRTGHDYTRYLEQMLMLNNHRLKRHAFVAEGLDGPKNYPPESIKITKRGKGPQLLYCENPRISLSLSIPQLLQNVTPERRDKIRDIYEASPPRSDTEDIEKVPEKRSWYQQIDKTNSHKDIKWETPIQFPRSKWDSEDEETSSVNVEKEKIGKSINQQHVSLNEQERCFPPSNVSDENKNDNTENIEGNIESSEKTINDVNNETLTSVLLQSPGDEKLASEYEQFMKMVCTDTSLPTVTDVENSPKKNSVKAISPCSYHNFNIESNLVGDKNFKHVENKDISQIKIDNTSIEVSLKGKFEKKSTLQTLGNSIKSIECEDSTLSTDSQIQLNANIEHTSNNESEDSKSIPSDWENVRIKVEKLSDENTEPRKVKKSKKRKKVISSSDSSSSTSSSDSEKEKKKKKRKRKILSDSSSDSDSTDSSSSSSSESSSSSDEKRKRRRKKKKMEKKRKKAKRISRIKKKRRKMNTDSSSSDSDEQIKKKKKGKKRKKDQLFEAISNNIDVDKMLSKSPASSLDQTTLLQSMTPTKTIEGEITIEDKKRTEIISTRNIVTDINMHEEHMKRRQEKKENKSSENLIEEWEMDSVITTQQNDDDNISIQEHIEELRKIDKDSEKDKYRKKRKYDRDNNEQGKEERLSKTDTEIIPTKPDEEIETKKKKRREKDIENSTEFLTSWEVEDEHITSQIIHNEAKISKIMGKQKREKWGETDFDTLNVPSLTQLEKEVSQRHLLADEWEVDSLEAISDLTSTKRKYNQNSTSKKIEKEVRYDKKTDTYIAIEKESGREMRKRQERLCAIRIWEEEQEEGEKEEMLLLKERSKRKKDDWDIEEESFLRKNNEEIEICKVDDIIKVEKEWAMKPDDEDTITKEDSNNLIMKLDSKRTKKSRWDMGSQSEEKSETKDIWEEEYEWSEINQYEQKLGKAYIADCLLNKDKIKKEDSDIVNRSEHSDLIDLYHRKLQDKESMEESWASGETATRHVQTEKENTLIKPLVPLQTNEEQIVSTKEAHQTKNQRRKILEPKYQKGTIGLYSPSSPALSQKSQDIEASNDTSFSNPFFNEKRNKETLLTMEESVSAASIPLQLTKLRDTKHITSQKIENILDMQSEDKISTHKFDIKNSDNLFDDLSLNGPEIDNSKSICMDIFAEYESRKSHSKQYATCADTSSIDTKEDEINESKTALKLIPKQLLIRRANEQAKSKRVLETSLEDPVQHAAALLTIQKKLLESHALKNDNKDLLKDESLDSFKSKHIATDDNEIIDKENKNDDIRKYEPCTSRNLSPISAQLDVRSPIREQRKKSPNRKENEKRYLHNKNKKERRSDDAGKYDRKENKSSKSDFTDNRRRPSPSRERKRRNGSPYASWERQRSGSRSPGPRSWSRSHSRSPKRKDDSSIGIRDRKRKRERYDDERSGRSRTDERRERYIRSPPRSNYNEDNRKHGSKSNRDDWRPMESEKYRDNRFRSEEEMDRAFWQYENDNVLRDANESMDSYMTGQDLPIDYNNRSYYKEESLERDMMQDSPQSRYRKRRERQWESDKDSSDLEHHGQFMHRLDKMSRNQTPPRAARHSPIHQTLERFRRHSRSWSRSRSRTRSRSRSRSRSRTRSRSDSRSRALKISSRSPSPQGRRIEIIQLGVASGANMLDSEINSNMDTTSTNFQYSDDIENGNRYYYSENNLTYPPIDESTTSSPKRLSLDDRLELELGIKKPHGKDSTLEYSSNFNTNVIAYPSPPPQQQQQMMYRQQPTVVQVGNVLQVVPADFNGMQTMRRETAVTTTPPTTVHGSSQVVRVGNVLQVVPTPLDWSGSQSSTVDQSNTVLHSTAVPTPSPVSSMVPLSIPVPVPVPLPVPPAIPSSTVSPASLPLPLPVPVPVPVPATVFLRNEAPPQKIVQPVYNYEAILEIRRKEREERKRLREARRKEKERRRIERTNRRALRQLEKNSMIAQQADGIPLDPRKGSIVDPSVLKALREGEEQDEEQSESPAINPEKEEEETTTTTTTTSVPVPTEEDEDPAVEEDEDEDEDEPEIEDDEEEEEEAEDEDEDDDDEEKTSQTNQQTEIDEAPIVATDATIVPKIFIEVESKEWLELPPPPLKGILIAPGFRDAVSNGDIDDLMNMAGDTGDISDKDEEVDQNNECDKDVELDAKPGTSTSLAKSKSKLMKLLKKKKNKKSVQFADGVKPGEGTSPSGGEGDMPSPPPPAGVNPRDGFKELRRRDMKTSSRKSRKQEKRTRPPKTKKKVKVKIIKLKKPRVSPLAAMMMDDSDELDDRSPPPPPLGSPPPPHLWPSYLSTYNTAIRTVEQPQMTSTLPPAVQAPPPPTPLPLLVPPPPLNYTIQPCSKA